MPKLEIRVYAAFRELFSFKTLKAFTEAEDVGALIEFLSKEYSLEFGERLLDPVTGRLRPYNKILVNGRDISHLDGLETRLVDGDVVVFFPPAGGG